MKKIVSVLLVLVMILSMLSAVSCGSCSSEEPDGKKYPVTRVTVDVNPSIEFIVGEDGKVASVTALNDDGSILIAGEVFVGKTPEQAIELAVSLACNTGYLIEGNVQDAANNKVKISVSGSGEYSTELASKIEKKAKSVLGSHNVKGIVEKTEALKLEQLRALAAKNSVYTEEELAEMNEEQLLKVLMIERIDTALLLTEELRTVYYSAKANRISFVEREETAKIIDAMGGIYALVHNSYKAALDAYGNAITNLDTLRYNLLVSPDSSYQRALVALREAKGDMIQKKNYMISVESDTTKFSAALNAYTLSSEVYNSALAAFQNAGNAINETLYAVIVALRSSEETLKSLESLFAQDVKAELNAKAKQLEDAVNAKKDAFFTEFENAHKNDITAIENSLKDSKLSLIDSIAAN